MERRRRSGSDAPWAIPKRSCPSARGAARWRVAQSVVRRTASSSSARPTSAGGQMSRHMAISDPSCAWHRATDSGVKRAGEPSYTDRNVTASSSTATIVSRRENTWKPPESGRIGPSQPMKRCRPPRSAIRSSPGRKCRWYAFPSRMVVPSARSSAGSTVLTVAFVPTGMNAGVGTSPCAVCTTPARAVPSVARSVYASLIDAHIPSVDDQVAAVLEAQALVVGADSRIVAKAVEAEEAPSGRCRGPVGPLDDCLADALAGAGAADGELGHVHPVRRLVGPVHRIVPEQGHGRDSGAVELRDVHLPALDCRDNLLLGKRQRPLLVPAFADPDGRLVEQRGHCGHVSCLAPANVHSRSIASPNE